MELARRFVAPRWEFHEDPSFINTRENYSNPKELLR
jgi:hypothetical protein